jgi:hypothetical protein
MVAGLGTWLRLGLEGIIWLLKTRMQQLMQTGLHRVCSTDSNAAINGEKYPCAAFSQLCVLHMLVELANLVLLLLLLLHLCALGTPHHHRHPHPCRRQPGAA